MNTWNHFQSKSDILFCLLSYEVNFSANRLNYTCWRRSCPFSQVVADSNGRTKRLWRTDQRKISMASKIALAANVVSVRAIHSAVDRVGVRRSTDNAFQQGKMWTLRLCSDVCCKERLIVCSRAQVQWVLQAMRAFAFCRAQWFSVDNF